MTLGALVLLVAISVVVYFNKNKKSTIDLEASHFKVEDTAAVDKIFLADKNNHAVTAERTPQGWVVEGKYPVRPDVILTLLSTFKNMDVKTPVAKSMRATVLKRMATQSIKVEIYSKRQKIRQYYVGSPTQDYTGTFMLLTNLDNDENYEEPFITYVPGFEGFLSTRYITSLDDWRSTLAINFTPPDMKSLSLEYHEMPDSSFSIELANANTFTLKNRQSQPIQYDILKMKQYLAYFQNVHYDMLLTNTKDHITDSLYKSLPFATLTIRDRNNDPYVYNFLHMKSTPGKNAKYGVDYKYDPDNLYMRFADDKELAIIQYFVFGKLLQTSAYFTQINTVKK